MTSSGASPGRAEHAAPVAVIDCGTNSVRLLVAAGRDGRLETLERDMVVTRLGEGVDASGRLSDAAIDRTVAAIDRFVGRAHERGATTVRVIGTSAVRDAADRDRFLAAVGDATGVVAEVIDGTVEAELSFAGAVRGADAPSPAMVLDIGGGSTEVILGEDGPRALVSQDMGCVRLTELALRGDPPSAEHVERVTELAVRHLTEAQRRLDLETSGLRAQARALVAVAGTATTLAALHLGLEAYDASAIHGTWLPSEAVGELVAGLSRATTAEIAAWGAAEGSSRGPVAPGREDVLLAGAVILDSALAVFGFDGAIVSEADLLDGAAWELLEGRAG